MKTLSQIAKELGVSRAAVSYVYNNKWREQRINEALAAKIMEKIKVEGCVPDQLGKQLRTGRTNTIGVLLTDLERYFNLELLGGIQKKLTETDYLMLLGNSYFGKKEYSFFSRMLSRKVDGIIFCPSGKSDEVTSLLKNDKPQMVFLDNYLPEFKDIPYIATDSYAASSMIVEHCASCGCRKMAWIGGHEKNAIINDRLQGFLKAMKERNLKVDKQLISRGRSTTEAIETVFSQGTPDALIFDSLVYIDIALDILKEKKMLNGMKVRITGFDRPSLSGAFKEITGAIPYVKQDTELMGSTAAQILIDMISGKVPEKKEYLINAEFITPGKEK
ncbi:MAG: hypothetical protein A2020_13745 [Lentisphaerae bacterium GWF2_45_14]|nr:MAG: hypothetical protein A2020_13745 [Lentisphaerae bacterium GWF2_45_14]